MTETAELIARGTRQLAEADVMGEFEILTQECLIALAAQALEIERQRERADTAEDRLAGAKAELAKEITFADEWRLRAEAAEARVRELEESIQDCADGGPCAREDLESFGQKVASIRATKEAATIER
jgi:hypothetical protein